MKHLFNWTATSGENVTFQFDSFLMKKREQKKLWIEVEKEVKLHFSKKEKLVCWAVTNCRNTYTDRITPAKELAKHLPEKLQLFGSGCIRGMNEHAEDHGRITGGVGFLRPFLSFHTGLSIMTTSKQSIKGWLCLLYKVERSIICRGRTGGRGGGQ